MATFLFCDFIKAEKETNRRKNIMDTKHRVVILMLLTMMYTATGVHGACKEKPGSRCQYQIVKLSDLKNTSNGQQLDIQNIKAGSPRDQHSPTTFNVQQHDDANKGNDVTGTGNGRNAYDNVATKGGLSNFRLNTGRHGLLLRTLSKSIDVMENSTIGGEIKPSADATNNTNDKNRSEVPSSSSDDVDDSVTTITDDGEMRMRGTELPPLPQDQEHTKGKMAAVHSPNSDLYDISDSSIKIVIVTGGPGSGSSKTSQSAVSKVPVTSPPRTKSKSPLKIFGTVLLLLLMFGAVLAFLSFLVYPSCKASYLAQRARSRSTGQEDFCDVERDGDGGDGEGRGARVTPWGTWCALLCKTKKRKTMRIHKKTKTSRATKHETTYRVGTDLDYYYYYPDSDYVTPNNNNKKSEQLRSMLSLNFNDTIDDGDDVDGDNDQDTCSVPFTPVSERAPSPIPITKTPTMTPTPRRGGCRTTATTATNSQKSQRSQQSQKEAPLSADSTSQKKLPRTSTHRYSNYNKSNNRNSQNSSSSPSSSAKKRLTSPTTATTTAFPFPPTTTTTTTIAAAANNNNNNNNKNNNKTTSLISTKSWPSWDETGSGCERSVQSRGDRQITNLLIHNPKFQSTIKDITNTVSPIYNNNNNNNNNNNIVSNKNNRNTDGTNNNNNSNAAEKQPNYVKNESASVVNFNHKDGDQNSLKNKNHPPIDSSSECKSHETSATARGDNGANQTESRDTSITSTGDNCACANPNNELFRTPSRTLVAGLSGCRLLHYANHEGRAPVVKNDEFYL